MGSAGWIILVLAVIILYFLVTGRMTNILSAAFGSGSSAAKKGG